MKFTIEHILIENFRCFDKLETDLWNKTIVQSSNEGGKSTLASATTWCLFGKSINNDSNFEIVPYGQYGKVSPSVTLDCMIDDRPVTLQRTYKAKKTRDGQFSEYATTTFINGIETGSRAFAKWISKNICDEQVFRIISNPTTFFTDCPKKPKELDYMAQRRLLLSIIGGQQSDKEIAAGSNRWIDLVEQIDRYGDANTYLIYLKNRYSALQKDMDSFAVRIDQQRQNIKAVEHSKEETETLLEHLSQELKTLESKNEKYRQSQNTAEIQRNQEKQADLMSEIQQLQEAYNSDMFAYERQKTAYSDKISQVVSQLEASMKTLKEYLAALDKLKNSKVREVCQTCGQRLDGKAVEASKAQLAKRIQNGNTKIAELKENIAKLQKSQKEYEEAERRLPQPVFPVRIKEAEQELTQLRNAQLSAVIICDMDGYAEERRNILERQDQLKHEQFIIANNAEIESVIRGIENSQQEEVKELSETQRLLELTKKFISEKCSNAENAINALFENVRFKLFEKNKSNDEVRETCILTFNGINYKDLSTSTKTIAALEVVNAFQKYYNCFVPLVLDNMESVTGEISINAQAIMLYVKEEPCPNCGSHRHSRRKPNGTWECLECGIEFMKKLEIMEELK